MSCGALMDLGELAFSWREADRSVRVLKCHTDRAKRIVTESSPSQFLSVGEDGAVRQHDLRRPHVCRSECPDPLFRAPAGVDLYSISVSPLTPYTFAVCGQTDCIYICDRRMTVHQVPSWGPHTRQAGQVSCVRRLGLPEKEWSGVSSRSRAYSERHVTSVKMSADHSGEVIGAMAMHSTAFFSMYDDPVTTSMRMGGSGIVAPNGARTKGAKSKRRHSGGSDSDARPRSRTRSADGPHRSSDDAPRTTRTTAIDDDDDMREFIAELHEDDGGVSGAAQFMYSDSESDGGAEERVPASGAAEGDQPRGTATRDATVRSERENDNEQASTSDDDDDADSLIREEREAAERLRRFCANLSDEESDEDEDEEEMDLDTVIDSESDDDDDDHYYCPGALSSEGQFKNVPLIHPRRMYKGAQNYETVKDCEFPAHPDKLTPGNFVGNASDKVCSGSDDGNFFVWDKLTGRLEGVWQGGRDVVNVIEQHPTLPVLAVAGIDNTPKIFAPTAEPVKPSYNRTHMADRIIARNSGPPPYQHSTSIDSTALQFLSHLLRARGTANSEADRIRLMSFLRSTGVHLPDDDDELDNWPAP